MSAVIASNHPGMTPSTLRVERRANGDVRLRILVLGQSEAVCDLADAAVDDLVAALRGDDS